MTFFVQLVHTLRHIFRCGGKFDSVVCWWEGSNSKWPPFHTIEWLVLAMKKSFSTDLRVLVTLVLFLFSSGMMGGVKFKMVASPFYRKVYFT